MTYIVLSGALNSTHSLTQLTHSRKVHMDFTALVAQIGNIVHL